MASWWPRSRSEVRQEDGVGRSRSSAAVRLVLVDVQAGHGHRPGVRASTRAGVSTTAPRLVLTRIAPRFIAARPRVDQVPRLGGEGHVEADEVGRRQQVMEPAALGAGRARRWSGPLYRQAHVEAAQQLRHPPGDTPEAHQADRRAGELAAEQLPSDSGPAAAADHRVGLGDPPARRQHQRHRQLGCGVGEHVRVLVARRHARGPRRGRCCRSRPRSSRPP